MKKLLLVIGGILVIIIVALVIVVLNVGTIVNKNKDRIVARAESELKRDITIGNIGVTIWGGIGVNVEDFTIADDPSFSTEPFVKAKSLQVSVKFMPLLRKEVQVKHITLNEPVIRIIRNEEGMLNAAPPSTPVEAPKGVPGTASGEIHAAPLAIALVNISKGDLTYVDRIQGVELELGNIESRVRGVELTKPIDIELEAAIFGDNQNVKLEGRFGPVGEVIDVNAIPLEGKLTVTDVTVDNLTGALPKLKAAIPPDLKLNGPITAELDLAGTTGALSVNATIDGTAIAVRHGELFSKQPGIPLTVTADARYTREKIAVNEATIRFHLLEGRMTGTITQGDAPEVNLSVSTSPVPLSGWEEILPATKPLALKGTAGLDAKINGALAPGRIPEVSGTASIKNAGATLPGMIKPVTDLNSAARFTGTNAQLDNAALTIGATTLKANAKVQSYAPLKVTYTATSDAIHLEDFRPTPPKLRKPEVLRDAKAKGTIEGLKHTGRVESSGGAVANIDYQNMSGNYDIEATTTHLTDFHMQTLDGTIDGAGTVKMIEKTPSFDITAKVRGVNVVDAFAMIPGSARSLVKGKVDLDLKASGKGNEWSSIQKTVSGDGLAQLFDGALLDFNVFKDVLDELGARTGRQNWISQNVIDKYPKVFKDPDTKFKDMKSDFVLENGRLKARNVALDAGNYTMTGAGSVGFDQTVDLKVTMKLTKAFSTDLIKDIKEAKYLTNSSGQIEVPFTLTGTIPNVRPGIDAKFIGAVVQRALIEDGGKNLINDLLGGKKKQ